MFDLPVIISTVGAAYEDRFFAHMYFQEMAEYMLWAQYFSFIDIFIEPFPESIYIKSGISKYVALARLTTAEINVKTL